MNHLRMPVIVMMVLGILFAIGGLLQDAPVMSDKKILYFGTFVFSGAVLFAAAGIAWAISNTGQNARTESGDESSPRPG